MATIEWLGHASFRIKNGKTIYIDPWKIQGSPEKADVVLISHDHYDHLVQEDVDKVSTAETVLIGSADVPAKLSNDVKTLKPGDQITHDGITIRATPAYNVGKDFHPRSNDWLGFLITMDDETIYYAGDTDVIPEMESLGKVDVALLPIGGTYTMDAEEAAKAAGIIKPKRCIPYHYGDIVGSREDAEKFKAACSCPTDILEVRA